MKESGDVTSCELDVGLEPSGNECDTLGYKLGKVDDNVRVLELDDVNDTALGCDLGEMDGGVLGLELGEKEGNMLDY